MKNEEFIELRNKFILGVVIALIITIPFLCLFISRYSGTKTNVYKSFRNKETFIIYVSNSSCDNCEFVEKKLEELDVSYLEYNLDKAKDKDLVIDKIGIKEEKIKVPALIYVKEGVPLVNSLDISEEDDILDFIKYSKLV